MKVEYSYYGSYPSLTIKGADFIKAFGDKEEVYLLEVAIKGFGEKFGITTHFDKEVNDTIVQWLSKSGEVVYVIKERCAGRTVLSTWCEVYVRNGSRLVEIVISDNGRDFCLHKREG